MTVVIADYFRLFIFPYPLHADRAPPIIQSWKDWRFILSCAWLSFLLLVLAFAYRNKKRALTWSLGYCFIALLPVSNIIPIYNPMAERYLYMVSIGACWAMAYLLWAIIMRIRYYLTQKGFEKLSVQLIPLALVLIIFAGYGAKTVIRNRDWKSDKTLFLKEAAAGSSNARVYYNLAYIFQSGDDLKQAAHFYRKALSLNPHFIEASNNLAGIDDALGNSVEALTLYNNPAMSKSRNPKVYENWGRILEKTSPEKAASAYRQALKISPKDSFARLRLAFCLIQEKKIPEALSEIKQIEKDDPSYANAYLELGKIDDEMGRYEDAIKQFKKFVERDPGSDEGLMNLGVAYHHVGNFDQAVFWLKKSIALNSSNAAAYYNFGVVKSDQGNLNEAVQVLKKALQIDSKYEDAAYNLGVIEQKMAWSKFPT